jgi:hypothetical protein
MAMPVIENPRNPRENFGLFPHSIVPRRRF